MPQQKDRTLNVFGGESDVGELVLLDHDGSTIMRRRVTDYCFDTHFDDIVMADFLGTGGSQIVLEK